MKKPRIEKVCPICLHGFSVPQYFATAQFCSQKCHGIASRRTGTPARDTQFHSLTFLKDMGNDGHPNYTHFWSCQCVCGQIKSYQRHAILSGSTVSCGCIGKLRRKEAITTHNNSRSVEYSTWQGMKQRCYNPRAKRFDRYGGRGIKVCDAWLNDFPQFLKDMGKRPPEASSIDRIDNNGDYSPTNCRWSYYGEQNRNHSRNHWITFNNETKVLQDWATPLGLTSQGLIARLAKDLPLDKALTTPTAAISTKGRRQT